MAFYSKKKSINLRKNRKLKVNKQHHGAFWNLKKLLSFKKFYKILYNKFFTLRQIDYFIKNCFNSKKIKKLLNSRSTSWFKRSNKFSSKSNYNYKRLSTMIVFKNIYKSIRKFKLIKKLKQKKMKKFMFKSFGRRRKWNKRKVFFKKAKFNWIRFYYNTKKFVMSLPAKYYYKKMLINFKDTGILLNRRKKIKNFKWNPSIRI